jgi:SAM-dependent methyltransferase
MQQNDTPWYEQWFDENYLLLYHHRNRTDAEKQVSLIIDTLKPSRETAILDLACGEGRYAALLKEQGYNVMGLDLSKTLISIGRERYPDLDLRVGDMRDIQGKFDLILSLFSSFGYFDSDEENENVLISIYKALNPGGVFWLDFLTAQEVEKNLKPRGISQYSTRIQVEENRKIENGRIIKDIHFQKNGEERSYMESVRLFTRDDLEGMFERVGFRVAFCFGDYCGAEWTTESPRTILVGTKQKFCGGQGPRGAGSQ